MVTPQVSLLDLTVEAGILKEAKDTQGINSGGSPKDNMASDFSTPQFHATNDVCLHYVWFVKQL